jgi:hypothetical protein
MEDHISPYKRLGRLSFRMCHRQTILDQLKNSNRVRLRVINEEDWGCPECVDIICRFYCAPGEKHDYSMLLTNDNRRKLLKMLNAAKRCVCNRCLQFQGVASQTPHT